MNAQCSRDVNAKGQRTPFSRGGNGFSVGEPLPCDFFSVHHQDGIKVVIGFNGSDVDELPRDGHCLARISLDRVEGQPPVVKGWSKVRSCI